MNTKPKFLCAFAAAAALLSCSDSDKPSRQEDAGSSRADGGELVCGDHCAEHQDCDRGADGGVVCLEECDLGFAWEGDSCQRVPGMDCSEDGAMSIAQECADEHRECVEVDGGAECGDCVEDYLEEGSDCVEIRGCADLDCEARHRECTQATDEAHAVCAECTSSFTETGGECVSDCPSCTDRNRGCGASGQCGGCLMGHVEDARGDCVMNNMSVSCADLDCGENRSCDEGPPARCLDACLNDWVWDSDISGCRVELTCEDDPCPGEQDCDDRGAGEDRRCTGASCPQGEGRNQAGDCEACAGGSNCGGMTGATGEVLATAQGCRCEPADDYFINAAGTAQRCDADGDGWINDEAAASIEGSDPRLAACALRHLSVVELINDAGQRRAVDVSPSLPLYEHPTNDGGTTGKQHPSYGGMALAPDAINSFTKACITERADFNKNGIADVSEHPNAAVNDVNARVEGYFERYRQFAYFTELHEGWYSASGTYTIRERVRSDAAVFPLRYPADAHQKWQTCERHVDSGYLASGFAVQAGRDFSGFSAETGWSGMNHHSQFKCVQVVSSNGYGSGSPPQQAYIEDGRFQWAGPEGAMGTARERGWVRNVCTATLDSRSSPNPSIPNTAFPTFSCGVAPDLEDLEPGAVTWVAVDYVNGSQERGVSLDGSVYTPYLRGCINECAEHDSLPAARQCASDTSSPGHGCRADLAAFGTLVCGCKRNFAGADCSIPCTDAELLTNIDAAQFPDTSAGEMSSSSELRAGYWMCGGFSGSSNYVLSGGGYTLRGEISATAVDGTVLSGGGYTLRAR